MLYRNDHSTRNATGRLPLEWSRIAGVGTLAWASVQSAIDITLQRFAEYHKLQGAFGRRALIEQAKGILMARHSTSADHAFEMLRDHSQHNGHPLGGIV